MRTIRASEIGAFLYCRRSWWYQLQGFVSENKTELAGGTNYHRQHGRQVVRAAVLRLAGWGLLLLAVILAAIALTAQLIAL